MDNRNDYFDLDSVQKRNQELNACNEMGGLYRPNALYGRNADNTKKKYGAFFIGGLATGLVFALMISGLIYVGMRVQEIRNPQPVQPVEVIEDTILTEEVIRKFREIEEVVKKHFYSDDLNLTAMEEGVYRGYLHSIGDDYSEYFSQEELADFMNESEGIYYGIGAIMGIDTETGLPIINSIFDGAPASEVNLRKEDIIYEVDGVPTYGYTLTEVVSMIKGEEGTRVTLTIVREGELDVLYVEVERRKVENPTVSMEMLDETTAYIEILEFDTVTVAQFKSALSEAKDSGMTGMILDLRGNPGGNMTTVVQIARMLLPKGLIVYTEDKYGRREEYTSDGDDQIDVPMTVLIDGYSASASEILAGAIQDYGIGLLVGKTTFGKGIVQRLIDLKDGSGVRITVSRYFTPNGNNIHGVGIEPDVECDFDAEQYYGEEQIDTQLNKALEVLDGMR